MARRSSALRTLPLPSRPTRVTLAFAGELGPDRIPGGAALVAETARCLKLRIFLKSSMGNHWRVAPEVQACGVCHGRFWVAKLRIRRLLGRSPPLA